MGATARVVDLTNLKEGSGINKSRVPAGDYAAIIQKVEDAAAKDGINQYLFYIKLKDRPSSILPYYCKLQDNQLWKLRNIFIAAGKTVPKKKLKVDPNTIVGKLIGVTIEDTEWDGKEQSEVAGVFPSSDLDPEINVAEGDEDDEPIEDDGADDLDDIDGPADAVEDTDEVEETEETEEAEEDEAEEPADPYEGLDRTELKKRIKALQGDFKILTKHTDDDLKGFLSKLEASSDEEEEEVKPARSSSAKKAKPNTDELSDDDLDTLNIDDL